MIKNIKILLKGSDFYPIYNYFRIRKAVNKWERTGKLLNPPHFYKVKIVRKYAKDFSLNVFIETGAYMGEMIYAVKDLFKKIYSVEISDKYYALASKLFAKFEKIHISKGDSAKELQDILCNVKEPALFWLDAHYQGGDSGKGDLETPIIAELESILNHNIRYHVILIDDARLFVGENDYPTLEYLRNFIFKRNSCYTFDVEDDIIRLIPASMQ